MNQTLSIPQTCPKCNSRDIIIESSSYRLTTELQCNNCNTEFWGNLERGALSYPSEFWKEKRIGYH